MDLGDSKAEDQLRQLPDDRNSESEQGDSSRGQEVYTFQYTVRCLTDGGELSCGASPGFYRARSSVASGRLASEPHYSSVPDMPFDSPSTSDCGSPQAPLSYQWLATAGAEALRAAAGKDQQVVKCRRLELSRQAAFMPDFADPANLTVDDALRLQVMFVYGTLRPDDDSGQWWTHSFVNGLDARPAQIRGMRLYTDGEFPAVQVPDRGAWPCDTVSGWLVGCPRNPQLWKNKVAFADAIEGAPVTYQRAAMWVEPSEASLGEPDRVACLVYVKQPTSDVTLDPIFSGDWLRRH